MCLVAGGLLATIDLRSLAERYVSHTLHRNLSIGAIDIKWSIPFSLELRDVRLANATWGSEPDMVRIERVSVRIELSALLHGVLRYRELKLVSPYILLEHKPAEGNWRFGSSGSQSKGGLPIVPKDRTQFPTLLNFGVTDGEIVYRTAAGFVLRLKFSDLAISSRGEDQPVSVSAKGFYNKTPVELQAKTDSFSALRNSSVPFGAALSVSTGSGRADFHGTMTGPLDFDGLNGRLEVDIRDLDEFAAMFGSRSPSETPVMLAGSFDRQGDRWELSSATGKIADAGLNAKLILIEGRHDRADQISVELNSREVDLKRLLDRRSKAGSEANSGELSLDLGQKRDAVVEARVAAQQVAFGKTRMADFKMHARLAPGEATLHQLRFGLAGGTIESSANVNDIAGGSHLVARTSLSGIEIGEIAQLIGTKPGQIAGQLYGGFDLEMTGKTLGDALRSSKSHAAIAMTQGQVARTLVEQASSDLRALFRKGEGTTQLTCLLAVLDLHDGIGTISPLRLKTGEATLLGGGKINLLEKRMNLTLRSDPSSTSLFSLDVPLQISGGLSELSVKPTSGTPPDQGNKSLTDLPQPLRELAAQNPCLR